MKIFIKNMTAPAMLIIPGITNELEIEIRLPVTPGEIVLLPGTARDKIIILREKLAVAGMYFIFSRKEILCEKLKWLITNLVESSEQPRVNYSVFIAAELELNYTYLSNIFSEMEGISIERFLLQQRVAYAALLLRQNRLNIGQIAHKLHYSSPGHFSAQFKRLTGRAPFQYRQEHLNMDPPVDEIP